MLDVDVDEEVETKNPTDYSTQNKPHIAKGMAEIMTGKYQFLHDLKLEIMQKLVFSSHNFCHTLGNMWFILSRIISWIFGFDFFIDINI